MVSGKKDSGTDLEIESDIRPGGERKTKEDEEGREKSCVKELENFIRCLSHNGHPPKGSHMSGRCTLMPPLTDNAMKIQNK